jgi:predicted SAM-dependent methyltransferase
MDIAKLFSLKAGTTGKLIVSPFAVVRWKDGKAWVLSARSKEAVSTTDANLLLLLNAFSTPKEPQEIYDELKHLSKPFLFSTIAALWQSGLLITADEAENAAADSDELTVTEESDKMAQGYAISIAVMTKMIADDLRAFGTHLYGEGINDDRLNLVTKLGGVQRVLGGIISDLEKEREPYLQSQLSRLNISPSSRGLKLHLGSGASRVEGWLNVDMPPADVAMHLSWRLPFADDSAEYVYLAHVFEHLYYKEEALNLLREIHRVLAPQGLLRVVVPDIEKCIRAYASGDQAFFETRKRYWSYSAECETPLEHFLEYAGAGIKPGDFWGHKYGYDFETLAALLRAAGFTHIERSEYMKSRHNALRIDEASEAAGFKYQDTYYSLFVEAAK